MKRKNKTMDSGIKFRNDLNVVDSGIKFRNDLDVVDSGIKFRNDLNVVDYRVKLWNDTVGCGLQSPDFLYFVAVLLRRLKI